jgi:hypothetical protein
LASVAELNLDHNEIVRVAEEPDVIAALERH